MQTADQQAAKIAADLQAAQAAAAAFLSKGTSRKVNTEATGHHIGKKLDNATIAALRKIYGPLSYAGLAKVMFLEAIATHKIVATDVDKAD